MFSRRRLTTGKNEMERTASYHDLSLHENDLIIISFHHIAFDNSSLKPFIKAFQQACWTSRNQQSAPPTLQYIDFALYEQRLLADRNSDSKMNRAHRYWTNLLNGYDWNKICRYVPNENRTEQNASGRSYSSRFSFDQSIVDEMILFTSTNNIIMFSLCLACYYILLLKLTGDNDLCISGVMANRFKEEMINLIGMFVNILPYRINVEPKYSFGDFVQKIHKLSNDILEHACLPYQYIVNSHNEQTQQIFPSSLFQYESLVSSLTAKNNLECTVDDGDVAVLEAYFDRDRSHGNGVVAFDVGVGYPRSCSSLIIDEISMVGFTMFQQVDARLQPEMCGPRGLTRGDRGATWYGRGGCENF
ncbi:unnamed protein product [Adineta ricciae]|uniref:Condensation domain-containing protein n=1 Tax=Adineta ricciae TaxID=249248 RepID=A0A815RG66_ADIRI|nr:unnamed protein product [Adineta ricciae]CAF1476831.1 unnamed protein product [Adineta ricciae]